MARFVTNSLRFGGRNVALRVGGDYIREELSFCEMRFILGLPWKFWRPSKTRWGVTKVLYFKWHGQELPPQVF